MTHCSTAPQKGLRLSQGNPWWAAIAVCLMVIGWPVRARAGCGESFPAPPTLLQVSASTWRVPATRGEPDATNGGLTAQLALVVDGRRTWLIGSGPTPAFGRALACAIERATGRRVTDVVDTRAAAELAMGNAAFDGARLWALPDVIVSMQRRCQQCRERLRARIGEADSSLAPDSVRVPDRPLGAEGDARGRLGPFDWIALARRPGERTLVLRHRADRIVVAQGLVWPDDVPDLHDTDGGLMLVAWQRLRSFATGARLIGEQGPVASPDAIDAHVNYLTALRRALEPRLQAGDEQAAMGRSVDLPGFDALPGSAVRHPLNVQRVYREMESALLR